MSFREVLERLVNICIFLMAANEGYRYFVETVETVGCESDSHHAYRTVGPTILDKAAEN